MRVLITWGSKRGGTAEIAEIVGDVLRDQGHHVVLGPADRAPSPRGFDAVIVGGSLYANRWHPGARRFIERNERALRSIPTWLFSSGPLDASADHEVIPPPRPLRALMDRVGAIDHVTFGGRLAHGATGVPAAAIARDHAGDWRNPQRIRAWAREVASALPEARPRASIEHRGRSIVRLFEYGVVGWAICAAVLAVLSVTGSVAAALVVHALVAPLVFCLLAFRYQAALGARPPLPMALAWTSIVAVLHVVIVEGVIARSVSLPSLTAYWLPLGLIAGASWAAGVVGAMLPMPKAALTTRRRSRLEPTRSR